MTKGRVNAQVIFNDEYEYSVRVAPSGAMLTSTFITGTVTGDNPLSQFMSSNGDGSGVVNLVGDYSETPTEFFIKPPAGEGIILARILIFIGDTGNFSASGYGNGGGLTNGIELKVVANSEDVLSDLTAGLSIKSNAEWSRYCYDVSLIDFGSGENFLSIRWTFEKSGIPVRLDADNKLVVTLNDDFSGLNQHHMLCQGYRVEG